MSEGELEVESSKDGAFKMLKDKSKPSSVGGHISPTISVTIFLYFFVNGLVFIDLLFNKMKIFFDYIFGDGWLTTEQN